MAEIVAGIYTTHGPQLNTAPEEWVRRLPPGIPESEWAYRPCYRSLAGTGTAQGLMSADVLAGQPVTEVMGKNYETMLGTLE